MAYIFNVNLFPRLDFLVQIMLKRLERMPTFSHNIVAYDVTQHQPFNLGKNPYPKSHVVPTHRTHLAKGEESTDLKIPHNCGFEDSSLRICIARTSHRDIDV